MIETLQSAGYVVTPCKGKAPVLPRWQQQRAALTAAELHQYRGHNVGLVLGVAPWHFVALDIDSTHEAFSAACEALAVAFQAGADAAHVAHIGANAKNHFKQAK